MARRSGSEKRQRTYILPVRLTEAERSLLTERASLSGCTRAALIRHTALNTPLPPRPIPCPTVDHKAFALLMAELGKIGSNINQLAKQANAGRFQENSVELAMRDLLALRSLCMKALGHEA